MTGKCAAQIAFTLAVKGKVNHATPRPDQVHHGGFILSKESKLILLSHWKQSNIGRIGCQYFSDKNFVFP